MRVISGSARGTVLHSIEDISTRPTLDRVKESLFNIIQNDIEIMEDIWLTYDYTHFMNIDEETYEKLA